MNIRNLFEDDNAVSPVIGVILMVAITVILAAVIASFVLGLGDQNNPAPTANFDFNYDTSPATNELTITHGDGDALDPDNVFLRGDQFESGVTDRSWNGGWAQGAGGVNSDGDVVAGNSVVVEVDGSNPDQYEARVVWEDPDSDSTSTLSTDRGPDA